MTQYYKATFSDGTVIKRQTASRRYTHAWLARWRRTPEVIARGWAPVGQDHGFCGSIVNAYNTLGRYQRGHHDTVFAEVAPVIEVTPQQYRKERRP